MLGSPKCYWRSRQRTKALWAWGVGCEDQLPHGATSLVQMDWGTQPFTAHSDFSLVPPRLNWQAKGHQSWAPAALLPWLCPPCSHLFSLREICYRQVTSWVQDAPCHLASRSRLGPLCLAAEMQVEREWLKNSHGCPCVIRNLLRSRQIWGLWNQSKFPAQTTAKVTFVRWKC